MEEIGFESDKIDTYFKGKYSDKDSLYVDEVFCDNNQEKLLQGLLAKQFDELLPEEGTGKKNLDHILYRIHYDINTRLSQQKVLVLDTILKWTLRIAGVAILPLLILFGMQTIKLAHLKKVANLQKETWVEIKAPAWTRAQFSLPDGTSGWLNSNSSIKYNGNFNTDRRVILTGEAFFDVFKDKERPFMVSTNDVVVKVLGTRFNIASYENEKNVEVVLAEGKLIFNDKEMNKSYVMSPNDLVVYNKKLKDFSTEIVQSQKYVSWTEGKLVFRNDPVDVIARRLERWYNIDIEIKGNLTEDLRLRATFVDEGFEQVLALLKRSLPINYKIEYGDIKSDGTYSKTKVVISPLTK